MKQYPIAFAIAASLIGQLPAQTLTDYQDEVLSQGPTDYFQLDGSFESAINSFVELSTNSFGEHLGGFTYDAFGNPTNSYFFVVNTDELANEVFPLISTSGTTNGAINAKGSITFLFRSLSGFNAGGERWLFDGRGLLSGAGTGNHNALGLFFERVDDPERTDPGALKLQFGDNTTVVLQTNDIRFGTWYYFALTYDEARVPNKAMWYIGPAGGDLSTGMTDNAADAVAGDGLGLFVGNRSTLNGAFRSPGNGRIDEFAIWNRELSETEVSDQFANLPVLTGGGVTVTNVIVDDDFEDGDRANTGPLQADWWSSSQTSGASIEVYPNQLGMVTGTSGRGIHGTFPPQNLEIGDTIKVTYTFTTPATVGTSRSTAFKVALMDFNDPALAADLASGSCCVNPLYTNLPGYMADMDVNTGTAADTSIREHKTPNTSGRFLGTTGEWISMGSSGDAGYTFAPNTEYVGVFSITRSDFASMDIFSSISQGGVVMDSHIEGDSSGIANNFGMVGFWVNSKTFGSNKTPGEAEDNGITFSNIRIELITTAGPTLNISQSGTDVVLSWSVAGAAGFQLQSTPALAPAAWVDEESTPEIVGDEYQVTNSTEDGARYYRLVKP